MGRFSPILLDHFNRPRNVGVLDDANAEGYATAPGRPLGVRLFLIIDGHVVTRATFQGAGCGALIGSASALTELIRERPIAECLKITDDTLATAVGGLPPDKHYCATVVIAALRNALVRYVVDHPAAVDPTTA